MKGKSMKKTEDMRAEYRREDLGKGVRGKHYAAFQKGSNLVLLTPELAKIFPTNEAVNSALESLVGVARSAVTKNGLQAERPPNAVLQKVVLPKHDK
jgi:hypothetical protein